MTTRRVLTLSLLSGGSLLLELALTRLFSAIYYPPYVFAIISLAILGIGLGSGAAAWRPKLRQERYQWLYVLGAALFSLILLIALAALSQVPGLIFVLVPLPYLFIGLTFASIFSATPERSTVLYMADLMGAGAGALLSIPIMNLITPINAVLIAGLLFTLAGLYPLVQPRWQAASVILFLIGLLSNLGLSWVKIDYTALNTAKPIQASLTDGQIIQTHWDAFGRTDLVKPNDGSAYRLYLDGAAASIMPPTTDDKLLVSSIGFFPFATNQPSRVLVIGPGGGLDVWFGLHSKAKDITAVEVNPASIDFVRDFGDYNGHLYDQPSVRAVVDEGRSLLRRENTKYDLIFLSQVVTLTSERLGYALTENSIYTVQAFQDYFAHLTDKGYVGLVLYDEITLTRALSTALAALRTQGLTDAQAIRYTMAFLDTQSGKPIPLLMISKMPLTREDSLSYLAVAHQVGFQPLYLPEVYAQPPLDAIEAGTHTFADIEAQSSSNISAPTDDRPFFFQFERGAPPDLIPLLGLIAGVSIVGIVLLIFSQRRIQPRTVRWSPIYFAALGIGFILIEITVIQQTRLFLGHPTLAVATTIAVLLIGGGLGSWLSGRLRLQSPRWPLVGVIIALVAWLLLWPIISQNLLALPLAGRIGIAGVCLLPLAFMMGMPFPLGLEQIAIGGGGQVALAWAVNGIATVAGSIGATTLATLTGYQSVLVAGIVAYLVAMIYTMINDFAIGRTSRDRLPVGAVSASFSIASGSLSSIANE